jgi:Uncharacterised protein family (UPF0175)
MQVTLEIPDNLAEYLIGGDRSPSQVALEAVAIEGYRAGSLTESEVRQMLGYETRMQVHTFLAEHNVDLHYTAEHLQQDIDASDKLYAQQRR